MPYSTLILMFVVSFATFNSFANEEDDSDANDIFIRGQTLYENGNFDEAADKFKVAIRKSPNTSSYHHWLAKSYGELTETSGWLKAMRLAENSRDSLERAVELDPENINALTDLMRYYEEAPSFLGGSDTKAREISVKLKALQEKNSTR